jgi:hypothetical protein
MKYFIILLLFLFPKIALSLTENWCVGASYGRNKNDYKYLDEAFSVPFPGKGGFIKCPGKTNFKINLKKAKEFYLTKKGSDFLCTLLINDNKQLDFSIKRLRQHYEMAIETGLMCNKNKSFKSNAKMNSKIYELPKNWCKKKLQNDETPFVYKNFENFLPPVINFGKKNFNFDPCEVQNSSKIKIDEVKKIFNTEEGIEFLCKDIYDEDGLVDFRNQYKYFKPYLYLAVDIGLICPKPVALIKLAEAKAKKEVEERARKLVEFKAKKETEEKARKLAEARVKKQAEEKARKLSEAKAKKEAEEKAIKFAEAKAKKEAEEKARKLAEAKAKKEAEEKALKLAVARAKKEALEKAKKETERKRKEQILDYKNNAESLYDDIKEFVSFNDNIDIIKLTDLYSLKPNSNKEWNKSEVNKFENLMNFVYSINGFKKFHDNKQALRFEKQITLKLTSKKDLKVVTKELNEILKNNFDKKKITKQILPQIKLNREFLLSSDYVQSKANKLLVDSKEIVKKFLKTQNKMNELNVYFQNSSAQLTNILKNNFGSEVAKMSSSLLRKINSVQNLKDKQKLKDDIEFFLLKESNKSKKLN